MFPRHGGQLADGFPHVLIIPRVPDLDDTHLAPVRRHVSSTPSPSIGANVLLHEVPYPGPLQFGDALFGGPDERIDPVGHGIKAVILRELEDGRGRHRARLRVHECPFGMRPFQEGELFFVAPRRVLVKADCSPLQGSSTCEAHLDQEILATSARSIPLDGFHQERGRPSHGSYCRPRIASANQIGLPGR